MDVRRAYFYAPVQRPIYVEIPDEDKQPGDEHKIGRLNVSLYGTRDAAQNWERTYSQFLTDLGFIQGRSSPCLFELNKDGKEISTTVHGDDFVIAASKDDIDWVKSQMEGKFEVKSEILSPDGDGSPHVRTLFHGKTMD